MAVGSCPECGGGLEQDGGRSVLAKSAERPVCDRCRRQLRRQFAGVLAVLGLGVALAPVVVNMPVWLFVAFGVVLMLVSGVAYWRTRQETVAGSGLALARRLEQNRIYGRLAGDVNLQFHVAIFGSWFLAYYVANLACGEWNPLAVGCNSTCKVIMWGSLGSMVALSVAYLKGHKNAAWLMLGVVVLQNYPHCQCENGFYIRALGVQPFCLIVPTLVGVANLWMMRIGRFKPLGFALTLSLLAGAFAVAATHRLGVPISWRI